MAAPTVRPVPGELSEALAGRLRALSEAEILPRIWKRDHSVWAPEPDEISNRLGWLDAVERSRSQLPRMRAFVEEVRTAGLTHTVLLGMGGSSLAAEVVRETFFRPGDPPAFDLAVLDTTHPEAIARLEEEVPLERTLFLVASKSGTTTETRSHMAYFLEKVGDGAQFAAITDPGTELEAEAEARGFRAVFAAPEDVGGRFSALTVFGLLPAALCGVDPELLLTSAAAAFARCLPEVPVAENPAAVLGAAMGEAALAGRDKLTVRSPEELEPFGAWLEQLVAESTGKHGRGILPVIAEPREVETAADRLVIALGEPADSAPAVEVSFHRPADLGGLFFVWELATAIAGSILGINPFDQPNVQEAKDRTRAVLDRGGAGSEPPGDLDALLRGVRPWDYVAIQAFVDPTSENRESLQAARGRILARAQVATTIGFGPRYLHSTGQLHKGGPPSGVFVQVFEEPTRDRPIPGAPYSFGELIAAQAQGDLEALRALDRRVARVPLEDLLTWNG